MNAREIFETPASDAKFEIVQKAPTDAATADGSTESLPMLSGYAIVWNATSSARLDKTTGQTYFARMMPGSARFTDPTLAMYGHDSKQVLGNTDNGSLRLASDDTGVRIECDLPDTSYSRDVANLVRDKYVKGMSFGTTPQKWDDVQETGPDGQPRTIRQYSDTLVDEVTVTCIPSFTQTTVGTMYDRAADDKRETETATPATERFEHRDDHATRLESMRLAMTAR